MINLMLNEAAEKLPQDLLLLLKRCVEKTLETEAFPFDAEVSLSIVTNEEIKALNHAQRGIDRVTDVLSFPLLETEDGVLIVEEETIIENCVFLGDIVISLEKAKEQAEEYGHPLERELGFLTVHSMLHILGYDHEAGKAEESVMFEKQGAVLNSLSLFR